MLQISRCAPPALTRAALYAALFFAPGNLLALPDLRVTDIRVLLVNGDPDLRQFAVTIENVGDTATQEGVIHGVSFWVDDEAVNWTDTWTESMEPGTSIDLIANGGPTGSPHWRVPEARYYDIKAWVDDIDRMEESDETNNELSLTMYLGGPPPTPRHVQIRYSEREGDPVTLSAIFENPSFDFPDDAQAVFVVDGEEVGTVPVNFNRVVPPGVSPVPWVEVTLEEAWIAAAGEHTFAVRAEPGGELLARTLHILPRTGRPDLVVNSISPGTGDITSRISPEVEVMNQGDAPTADGVVHRVDFFLNGERMAWSTGWTTSIAPGETVTIQEDGGPVGAGGWFAPPGVNQVEAVVDPGNRIEEAHEDNNSRHSLQFVSGRRGFRVWELTITDLDWTPSDPGPGDEVTFTATVDARWGEDPPETDVELTFFVAGEQVAAAEPVTPDKEVLSFTMTATQTWTAEAGMHEVFAFVDPENRIEEDQPWDNTFGRNVNVGGKSGGFTEWQSTNFTDEELADPEISGPTARGPDGVPNLLKYSLGLDRHDRLGEESIFLDRDAEGWRYVFRRPEDRDELTYWVEASTDLGQWSPDGIALERILSKNGVETWEARPSSDPPRLFFRLVVEN